MGRKTRCGHCNAWHGFLVAATLGGIFFSAISAFSPLSPLSDLAKKDAPSGREPGGERPQGNRTLARAAVFAWLTAATSGDRERWQDVLDAGTGRSSLQWLANATCARLTGVTASSGEAQSLQRQVARDAFPRPRACGQTPAIEVLEGNWGSQDLLRGKTWDAVFLDLLLGAVEAHAPFGQWPLLARLAGSLRPGGCLVLVGLEPLSGQEARLHDALTLLAGSRPYREYPESLVSWELNRSGLSVQKAAKFPMSAVPMLMRNKAVAARAAAELRAGAGTAVSEAAARLVEELGKEGAHTVGSAADAGHAYAIVARAA